MTTSYIARTPRDRDLAGVAAALHVNNAGRRGFSKRGTTAAPASGICIGGAAASASASVVPAAAATPATAGTSARRISKLAAITALASVG